MAQEEISKLYLSKLDYNIYETNLIIQKCLEMGLKIDVSRIQYDVNKEKGEIEYVKGSDFETVFEREISAYKLRYRRV